MAVNHQRALVTGSTSGIGEQLALQFAQEGCDLVLVSRSEDALARLCRTVQEQYGVDAHVIVADLSKRGEAERVFAEIQSLGLAVDILVNNAGTHEYGPFSKSDWDEIQTLMELNVQSVVRLTHLFLPGMLARDGGHILNLGSTGSFVPWPNDAVYGAGKAFILRFSEALAEELRGTHVGVTCLCPGVVETEFIKKGSLDNTILNRLTAMQPEPVAKAGIRAVRQGKWVHIAGWMNRLMIFLQHFVPRRLLTRIARWATRPSDVQEA